MKTFLLTLLMLFFFSCTHQQFSNSKYEALINQVDSIQIDYRNKKISLPVDQVENFKRILIVHIEPEEQRQFEYSVEINLFKKNELIARIKTIDSDKMSFANVYSDSFNFGFRMTYGIGMYLMETYNIPEYNVDSTGQNSKAIQ